ncbi:MAG: SIR2 family protein, partial [Planctomycetales bacterium]
RRLFPRHHVLARLAREGLCPVVLTTNYDLLLEGAWRLSGFELEQRSEKPTRSSLYRETLPHSPLKHMAVVTSPVEFVESGKANQTSLVVKVHGCVGTYRQGRKVPARLPSELFYDNRCALVKRLGDVAEWEENLRTMVFTYREIQNWRKDSWARDYLATTQRTRSVAFVGYALQDPVIHDAFRTVYEEMAEDQKRVSESRAEASNDLTSLKSRVQAATKQPQEAPAFFFGGASDQSFHATEVLQAATWAAGGASSSPHEHANYLRFSYLNQEDQFPNLDDLFLWTYHRTMRKRQLQMLTDELRPVAATLLRGQKILPLPAP